ncbi:hypothetical protein B0T21DRAFT_401702 [Apiosordaria backusii]|uniref:Uncharacterized protein n=1 Tax=Apiosordaria backusii TaxID=314023 RepID=A0AA40EDM9_9PEZI|nr:hypothetical protein B0T21DRAFT_401702 [Apiosordaria backusii]
MSPSAHYFCCFFLYVHNCVCITYNVHTYIHTEPCSHMIPTPPGHRPHPVLSPYASPSRGLISELNPAE